MVKLSGSRYELLPLYFTSYVKCGHSLEHSMPQIPELKMGI